jgi:hypothetical protein
VTAVDIANQILQEIALIGGRFWPVFPKMVMGVADRNLGL